MKLVVAVVHTQDADGCCTALTEAGFPCTRLASSGGFLERDNATLLIGVDGAQVDEVLEIVRSRAKERSEVLGMASAEAVTGAMDVEIGGATIFVVDVERFQKL